MKQFSFTLSTSVKTSAAIYNSAGLVRTLWSGRSSGAGTYLESWDEKDDNGVDVPIDTYTPKLFTNNVGATWEGVIGNTSTNLTGPTVHRGFERIYGLAITGTTLYLASGYAERIVSQMKASTSLPQQRSKAFAEDGGTSQESNFVVTDGTNVYWGGVDPFSPNKQVSFVFGSKVSDQSEVLFSSGVAFKCQYGRNYQKVLSLVTNTSGRITGMAVQQTGNYLFISRKGLNNLYVIHKTTGALTQTLSITNVQNVAVDASDKLWVQTGTTVTRYTVNSGGTIASDGVTVTGLVDPQAMACNSSLILVADGGSSQQVKAFSTSNGSVAWTMGTAGGYTIDATVNTNKFYFNDPSGLFFGSSIAFQADGSFWVVDSGNYRVLKYNASRVFQEQILYLPHVWASTVDPNNTNRVFADYLEFSVDYSLPLSPTNGSWALVKNWGFNAPANKDDDQRRLRFAATLSNGRTYACQRVSANWEVVELMPGSGTLRFTGITFSATNSQLYPDGSIRRMNGTNVGQTPFWYKKPLAGFDSSNNPLWGAEVQLATAPAKTATDPIYYGVVESHFTAASITASNVLVSWDGGTGGFTSTDFHLGGITVGDNKWLWKTARKVVPNYSDPFPADGKYDLRNGVNYAGGPILVMDNIILQGYHGEGWKSAQCNKWNIWGDKGQFITQFGVTAEDVAIYGDEAQPYMAGNSFAASLVKDGSGNVYLWHNDESYHGGVHRWKITGLDTITIQDLTFTSMSVNTNCTYRTFTATDEELVIWWGRLHNGPYKNTGDVSPYSPDDGNRIKLYADQLKANPSVDYYTNYYKGSPTVKHPTDVNSGSYDGGDSGLKTACSALWYACSRAAGAEDTSYGNPVKTLLLQTVRGQGYASYTYNGNSYPAFNYNNKQRYPDNWSNDLNPWFTLAGGWLKFLLESFEYVRPLFSTSEITEMNAFWTSVADQCIPHAFAYGDTLFVKNRADRFAQLDYTPKSAQEELTGSTKLLYFGGPNMHQIGRDKANRRMDSAGLLGVIGVMLGRKDYTALAKQFFKEVVMFATFPSGHYVDIFRGTSEKKPSKGMGYSLWPGYMRFADALARNGDTEMYTWTTTLGSISPAMYNAMTSAQKAANKMPVSGNGGHTSDGSTPKGLRAHIYSLCNLRNRVGNGANKDAAYVPIYATADPALNGNIAWLINGYDTQADGVPVIKNSVEDLAFGNAATFYKDAYIEATFLRTLPTSRDYRTPQVAGPLPGFCAGASPGNALMTAQMRDKVYPYPTTGQQSQSIVFSQPANVVYGATLNLGATSTAGLTVSYAISNTSIGGGMITGGVFTPTKVGSIIVTASQGGDSNHTAATPVTYTFQVIKAVLTATAQAASRVYNKVDPVFGVSYAGFVNGENVAVIDTKAVVTSNAVFSSAVGSYVLTPAGAADNNYSFVYVTAVYTISKGTLVLNVTSNLNKVTTDGPFTPTAVAYEQGSTTPVAGLTLVFSKVSGSSVTSISSAGLVTLAGTVGTSVMGISESANTNYNSVSTSFNIAVSLPPTKTAQSITFNALSPVAFGTAPGTLSATATSTLAVTFASSDSTIATCTGTNGTALTYLRAGTVNIIASQAGDATYQAAIDFVRPLTITKKALTVTGTAATRVYGIPNPALAHNAITGWVGSDTEAVLTTPITDTTNALQTSNVGAYNVIPGGGFAANYSFVYVNGVFTITKADQTIDLPGIADAALNAAPFLAPASATSGLSPVISIVSGPATVDAGGLITLTGTAGPVVVAADQAGNGNYNAAPQQQTTFTVLPLVKNPQVLTITPIPTQVFGVGTVPIAAISDKGLTVSVTVLGGPGTLPASTAACPTTLTVTGAGTIVLQFTQAGDVNTLPATPTDVSVIVNKAPNTIVFDPIVDKNISDGIFDVSATATAGAVTFSTDNSGVLQQLDNDSFNPISGGHAVITASQPGDANYLAAQSIDQRFEVVTTPTDQIVDMLLGLLPTPSSATIGVGATRYTQFQWDFVLSDNYSIGPRGVLTSGHNVPSSIIGDAPPNIVHNMKVYTWDGVSFVLLVEVSGNVELIHNFDVPVQNTIGKIRVTSIRDSLSKVDQLTLYGTII